MRRLTALALVLAIAAAAFVAGSWATWRASGGGQPPPGRKVLYWVDPMHPSYKSDKPGIAPDCGMALEPVYADEEMPRAGAVPPKALKVTSERQQLIGVATAVVESSPVSPAIHTVGRVTVDGNRVYRLVSTVEGVVRTLDPISVGGFVRKEQVLFTFYSTDFLAAQQAYFFALNTLERVSADRAETTEQVLATNAQLRSALDGLRNLGMTEAQLAELAKSRKLTRDIQLRSPVSGYVLARNVYPEQRLERGEELYRIADLSRVWVIADLFERDAPYVRAGSPVQLSVPYQEARFETRVGAVLPQFDAQTRTLKVRLEIANPDLVLRPDMFVDVTLPVAGGAPALTVPADALVDSGARKIIFVDLGNGYFEPRRVEIGWRAENRVQVVKGLMPGERIVVSGNFLLDSESRMRAVAMGVFEAETDVVCGMDVDRAKATKAGRVVRHGERDYFFCSDDCKHHFEAGPDRYLTPQADRPPQPPFAPPLSAAAAGSRLPEPRSPDALPPAVVAADRGLNATSADARGRSIFATDPVCGADVETTAPNVLKATHSGVTYYFFSEECRAAFLKEPDKYTATAAPGNAAAGTPNVSPQLPPEKSAAQSGSVKDPVCGMQVDVKSAAAAGRKSEYKGATYYFCSDDCKKQFDADPAKFTSKPAPPR